MWATETELRDGWQVVKYRRLLIEGDVHGLPVRCYVEQLAEPGARAEVTVESDETIRFRIVEDTPPQLRSSFDNLIHEAMDRAHGYIVDRFGRRVRPGVLEALSEALGVDGDEGLAAALRLEPIDLALVRAGFTPFGRCSIPISSALVDTGLTDRKWDRHYRLMLTQM